MGIREKMNENPALSGGIVGAVILIAVLFIYFQNRTPSPGVPTAATAAFFTEDDGQTYFKGDFSNLGKDFKGPKGKEAFRCYVYQYGTEKPFVACLEKYTPAGKQTLVTFYGNSSNANKPPPPEVLVESLVKKPGEKTWASFKDRAQYSMARAVPPKGEEPAVQVLPE